MAVEPIARLTKCNCTRTNSHLLTWSRNVEVKLQTKSKFAKLLHKLHTSCGAVRDSKLEIPDRSASACTYCLLAGIHGIWLDGWKM